VDHVARGLRGADTDRRDSSNKHSRRACVDGTAAGAFRKHLISSVASLFNRWSNR
jgi:hypothetical protein